MPKRKFVSAARTRGSLYVKKRWGVAKRVARLGWGTSYRNLSAGNYVPRTMKVDDFSGTQLIPRGPSNPFPDTRVFNMRYCESFSIDAAVTGTASYFFQANSIYDPNFTGAGHQPYGHDQVQSLYNHYEVIKSYITWEFQPGIVDTTAGQLCCGITLTDDTTAETNFNTIQERKNTRWTQVSPSDNLGVVKMSYDLKKMFPRASSTDTGALFGANPTEGAFFQCWTKHVYSGSEPSNVYGTVTIDYVVRVWELKDLGQS